jgi:glucose-1-phosphate cytidylyltransferase
MIQSSVSPAEIPVVILAGGRGTRLMEETRTVPKPMVRIGEKPILLHLMQYYASYGFRRFVICLGYKGHIIKDHFLSLHKFSSDLTIYGDRSAFEYHGAEAFDWQVDLVETGEHSLTATRVHRARRYLDDAAHFCLTYGDGLSDVNLTEELRFHVDHGAIGTVAAVHPPSRFGQLEIGTDGRVMAFREKGRMAGDFINGGFFIFRRAMLDRIPEHENVSLEGPLLAALADEGQLHCFKHEGFWQCMDTIRDRQTLTEIYEDGQAPWVRA